MRRFLTLTTLALMAFTLLPAPGAGADPNPFPYFQSTLRSESELPGGAGSVRVVNDDALAVILLPGNTMEVSGYYREPYLRVDAEGRVEVNRNSPSFYLNQNRLANVPVPPEIDTQEKARAATPEWVEVPLGVPGVFEFHDHRVHWMGEGLPPVLAEDGWAFDWLVPVTVNGERVDLIGAFYVDEALAAQLGVTRDTGDESLPPDSDSPPLLTLALLLATGVGLAGGLGLWSRRRGPRADAEAGDPAGSG